MFEWYKQSWEQKRTTGERTLPQEIAKRPATYTPHNTTWVSFYTFVAVTHVVVAFPSPVYFCRTTATAPGKSNKSLRPNVLRQIFCCSLRQKRPTTPVQQTNKPTNASKRNLKTKKEAVSWAPHYYFYFPLSQYYVTCCVKYKNKNRRKEKNNKENIWSPILRAFNRRLPGQWTKEQQQKHSRLCCCCIVSIALVFLLYNYLLFFCTLVVFFIIRFLCMRVCVWSQQNQEEHLWQRYRAIYECSR